MAKCSCGCGGGNSTPVQPDEIKEMVKERYAGLVASSGATSCCCGGSQSCLDAQIALAAGYTDEQLAGLPEHAAEHSFGCGNPVALAEIQEGQTVLDIGSGAGIDVFLAARIVGATGRVIGLDMTPEMIAAAEKNAEAIGATNVEFRLGDAENMPVETGTVDWIISNCVINLAPDKDKVFREAYRVLGPGGRLMVSDIVTNGLPEELRTNAAAWSACVAGALDEPDYLGAVRAAGFEDVEVLARVDYDEEQVKAILELTDGLPDCLTASAPTLAGKVSSIKVSAKKPGT